MNPNDSVYTAVLRLAQYEYHPIRTPQAGQTSFAWVKEYSDDRMDDDADGTYRDAMPTTRNFNDHDLFLTENEVNELIMAPESFMSLDQKKVFKDRFRDWELVVTEYKPQMPTIYDSTKGDEQRKKLRKATLLARMSPEDRKLFE